jgi:hypothetical protein
VERGVHTIFFQDVRMIIIIDYCSLPKLKNTFAVFIFESMKHKRVKINNIEYKKIRFFSKEALKSTSASLVTTSIPYGQKVPSKLHTKNKISVLA